MDLFIREQESLADLPVPSISYEDATLNFRSYLQGEGRFKSFDDEPVCVYECTLPEWSGITQTWNDGDGKKREMPFRITSTTFHKTAASLVNEWMKSPANSKSPAARWITENSTSLNAARRFWDAEHATRKIHAQKQRIKEMEKELHRLEIVANIQIVEARENRAITGNERILLAKEFGATDEDMNM